MLAKIIVFIGEGKSELAFFQEYIRRCYSINESDIKSDIVFQIGNNFILFSHPRLGSDHRGGDCTFISSKTYIAINKKIHGNKHIYSQYNKHSYVYIMLTDSDTGKVEEKINGVKNGVNEYCNEFLGDIIPLIAIQEIETWFLLGIGEDIIKEYPQIDILKVDGILRTTNPHHVRHIKEILDNEILIGTDLYQNREYTGRQFGKFLDIQKTKELSESFKDFTDKIDKLIV